MEDDLALHGDRIAAVHRLLASFARAFRHCRKMALETNIDAGGLKIDGLANKVFEKPRQRCVQNLSSLHRFGCLQGPFQQACFNP